MLALGTGVYVEQLMHDVYHRVGWHKDGYIIFTGACSVADRDGYTGRIFESRIAMLRPAGTRHITNQNSSLVGADQPIHTVEELRPGLGRETQEVSTRATLNIP